VLSSVFTPELTPESGHTKKFLEASGSVQRHTTTDWTCTIFSRIDTAPTLSIVSYWKYNLPTHW